MRLTLFISAILSSPVLLFAGEKPELTNIIFNGKDLTQWDLKGNDPAKSKWQVGAPKMPQPDSTVLEVEPVKEGEAGALVNVASGHGQSVDLFSQGKFGDFHLEIEVMVPKGSNSGIYVMGEYEVQVLDSFGKADKDMNAGDIGAIYGAAIPKINASKAPGEWQKFVIDFKGPKFDAEGKRTEKAKFLKVELNGKLLHENLEMSGPTPGGLSGQEHAEGPLMFQGDHGAVAYRNIQISPLK